MSRAVVLGLSLFGIGQAGLVWVELRESRYIRWVRAPIREWFRSPCTRAENPNAN